MWRGRHGCATVYVALGILGGLLSLVVSGFGFGLQNAPGAEEAMPGLTPFLALLMTVLGLASLACLVGMWMWKRWGFVGYIATTVVSAPIWGMVSENGLLYVLGSTGLGLVIFLVAMFIGQPNTFDQLE